MSLEYLTGHTPSQGKVTPLIDGYTYFQDFFTRIDALPAGAKLYLLNWHIDPWFYRKQSPADTSSGNHRDNFLIRKLQTLAARGVDIRILLWVNTSMFNPYYPIPDEWQAGLQEQIPFASVMQRNCLTVHYWRNKALDESRKFTLNNTALKDHIAVNTVDAFMGGCHAKFALLLTPNANGDYTGVGYTGGIDFGMGRYGAPLHAHGGDYWHDLQAKVEGVEIITDLFYFYKSLWDENVSRKNQGFNPLIKVKVGEQLLALPSIPYGALPLEDLYFDQTASPSDHYIQSLRTLPDIYPIFQEPEISFAPEGVFEFRQSLQHAIQSAQRYVYIEDQGMESLEVFGFLEDALKNNSTLKVILVTGKTDPEDPPEDNIEKVFLYYFFYSRLTQEQRSRVHFIKANRYVIHSKLYLIDDRVALIGSAGVFTRSLTQEVEHAVAFVAQNGSNTIVDLRERLWAELLKMEWTDFRTSYPGLDEAMGIWSATYSPTAPVKLPVYAHYTEEFPGDATLVPNDFFMPVMENGQVKPAVIDDADRTTLANQINGTRHNATYLFLRAPDAIFIRTLDLAPARLALVEFRRQDLSSGEVTVGKMPWKLPTSQSLPGGIVSAGIDFLEDERLLTREEEETPGENGEPLLPQLPLKSNLADQNIILHCTQGANAGQVRLIRTHEGRRITFEAFDDPVDPSDFAYELLFPEIGLIDLSRFKADFSLGLIAGGVTHLLAKEILFSSLLNQGYTARVATPLPYGESVAIHQKVTLKLLSSSLGTIEWRYDGMDGHPRTGAGETFEMQFTAPGPKKVFAFQHVDGQDSIKYEIEVLVLENSGVEWAEHFPTSREVADLSEPFRANVQAFIAAVEAAGLIPEILATVRPPERAYLMAYAYKISRGLNPASVDERFDTAPISWVHYQADGAIDLPTSKAAAQAMVAAYGIGETGAVFPSMHSQGEALDMKIPIAAPVMIKKKNGQSILVKDQKGLKTIADSYGVKRLRLSNHWSLRGN